MTTETQTEVKPAKKRRQACAKQPNWNCGRTPRDLGS